MDTRLYAHSGDFQKVRKSHSLSEFRFPSAVRIDLRDPPRNFNQEMIIAKYKNHANSTVLLSVLRYPLDATGKTTTLISKFF